MKGEKRMGNFTPGPWKSRDYKNDEGGIWIDCYAWNRKKSLGGTLATAHGTGTGAGNVEANARLIATAPELYEAIKQVISYLDSEELYAILKKALAKAEGKEA